MRIRLALVIGGLSASTIVGGCLPMVTHGPQVENALSGGLSAGWAVGPKYMQGDWGEWPVMVPSIGANISRGWCGERPEDGALQLGLHLPAIAVAAFPAGLMLLQGDSYYQFPATWTGELDAGVGLNASIMHVMPYAQLGRISAEGNGWYTTQGLGVFGEEAGADVDLDAIAWVPTIAYQSTKGNRTIHYFLTGSVVRELGECYPEGCFPPADTKFLVALGVTLQFNSRR